MKTKIALMGYGNISKGIECAVKNAPDMELKYIFTRRNPNELKVNSGATVLNANEAEKYANDIDVMIMCGGSANDLPTATPNFAEKFNVVDSFDTHAKIPEHFNNVDNAAKKSKHVGIIAVGWDPGMFSVQRIIDDSILPCGKTYTFWGKGVSQGHSDAIRRIDGVLDARQYTIPIESAVNKVLSGEQPTFTPREKHLRECFVVASEGADKERIKREIITMPHYFDEYDTTVHFISMEELKQNHSGIPHGGMVIHSGFTSEENRHTVEYKLTLDSNPEFTASVILAYARAAKRLYDEKDFGAKTVFDIPPKYLSAKTDEELRKNLL